MKTKFLIAAGVSAALMVVPFERANADTGSFIAGAAAGALGAVIINQNQRQRQRPRTTTTTTRRTAPSCGSTCQQNKSMQAALNHFGYNAGPVDGVPGSRTRSAIRSYESQMGLYADGNLDQMERDFLLSAYHRSQSGNYGPHYQAYSNGGNAGFLRSLNQERLGQFNGGNQPVYGNAGVQGTQAYQNPAPQLGGGTNNAGTYVGNGPIETAPAVDANPFANAFTVTPVAQSMSTHCSETQQLTVTNGGYIQAASPANSSQALSEQFCLAREFSTAKGQQLVSSIAGMTASDVSAKCQQFVAALDPAMASLTAQARPAVVQQVQQIAGQMGPQGMVQAGQICLGVGYTEDDPKAAIAGALLLTAGGQEAYGEIVGHHLREGFGVMPNPELAKSWHLETISAMDAGAPAAILPSQAGQRNAVIRAAYGANAAQAAIAPAPNVNAGGTLPTFVVAPTQ